MRKHIAILALFAFLFAPLVQAQDEVIHAMRHPSSGGGGGPTYVAGSVGTCSNASSGSCTGTLGVTPSAGQVIMGYAGSNGSSSSITITGETLTEQTGTSGCSNNAGAEGDCFASYSAVGGTAAFTCTTNGGFVSCIVWLATSSTKDAGGNVNCTASPCSVSTSAATTSATDVCFAMFYPASTVLTISSPYTTIATVGGGSGIIMGSSYYSPGSTGIQTASATISSSNAPAGILCLH